MVSFRPLTEDEYPAYLDYFIDDYAGEIASNYGLSQHDSLARAKQEIAEMLPEGVNTHGHVLLSLVAPIDQTNRPVGYLWYKPDTMMRSVFIYDFHIFTSCQGRGWVNRLFAFLKRICAKGALKRSDCGWQGIMPVPGIFTRPAVLALPEST